MANNNLVIKLSADIAKFQADMRAAGNSTDQAVRQMQMGASAVNSAMIGLAKGAAAALSVNFFAGMIKGAIDSMDALNDLKDATGASIANISALEDVAVRTGANFDTVGTAMIKFQKVLMDARPGSQAEIGLTALGLSADKLKNIDLGDAMLQYARAMNQFADDGDKARLMLEQTGKSVRELAPFLKDLAEQEKLVGTVSEEMALEAEKFNKELFAMRKNAEDVARAVAGPLITAFNGFMEAQRQAKKDGKFGLFTSPIQAELEYNQSRYTGSWGAPVGNAGRGNINPAFVKPGLGDVAGSKTTGGKTATAGLTDAQKIEQDAQRFVARFKEEADTFGKVGAAALIYTTEFQKMPKLYQEQALAHQKRTDKLKAEADAVKAAQKADADFSAATERFMADRERDIARLTSNTPTMVFKAQQDDLATLQDLLAQGVINEQLYAEAVVNRFGLANDKINEGKTLAQDLEYVYTNAFKNMEDSLASFVKTGKLDFSSLANSIIEDMARIAIQQTVTKPLMAMLPGLFGFANGGAFGSGGIQAFANGGAFSNSIVSSPTLFKFANGTGLMGEAGPEAIMPLRRGADGKLGVQASGFGGGGGSMVVNIIESPGNGGQQSRRTENGVDILDVFVEKVKSAIAGDINRGSGAVPSAMSQTYGLNRVAGAY